jgi:predicted short-subunit dehydrogenase-like oxidoreductase (DUF2520 family)
LALALDRAGHEIVGVVGRRPSAAQELAGRVGADAIELGSILPSADVLLLTVRDDAIGDVAGRLAPLVIEVGAAVHVSGLRSVTVLEPLAAAGLEVGSWHPLQALPSPKAGAERLAGAWLAITTESKRLAQVLDQVSLDIGGRPFRLDDELKPLYHAAAAAAANYVTTALGLGESLAETAQVPWEAARPLVEAVVANVFEMGAGAALTGPIARGDVSTVKAQLAAIREHAPELMEDYQAFGRATARLAGTLERFEAIL